MGMPLKTFTRYINIRPGPPASSSADAAAMAGIITIAAIIAAMVSKTATFLADDGIHSSLGR